MYLKDESWWKSRSSYGWKCAEFCAESEHQANLNLKRIFQQITYFTEITYDFNHCHIIFQTLTSHKIIYLLTRGEWEKRRVRWDERCHAERKMRRSVNPKNGKQKYERYMSPAKRTLYIFPTHSPLHLHMILIIEIFPVTFFESKIHQKTRISNKFSIPFWCQTWRLTYFIKTWFLS